MSKQNTLATVDFHGNPLTVITTEDGQRLVAMRPICDAIGVQWEAQLKRIKRDTVLSEAMSIMDIPSAGGEQSTVCLPVDLLNGWLFGISTSRVKPEIRQRLEDYQRECYKVLNEYWNGKQVGGERIQQQSEMVVAQAYAKAAYAADIVSRHVFNAVINSDADPFDGRWLLETHYAGPKREVVPAMREVGRDDMIIPVEGFVDELENGLTANFSTESLARLTSVSSNALMSRVRSSAQARELRRTIAARNKQNPATATAVAGSKR